jgi:hypothetical protein
MRTSTPSRMRSQAEDELVVRAVLDLEHPSPEELRECGKPARIGRGVARFVQLN